MLIIVSLGFFSTIYFAFQLLIKNTRATLQLLNSQSLEDSKGMVWNGNCFAFIYQTRIIIHPPFFQKLL